MADIKAAVLELIHRDEGVYSNKHTDAGGETVCGISRVKQPQWAGWPAIDKLKLLHSNLVELNAAILASESIMGIVVEFYKDFWLYDGVTSEAVAGKLFNMGVNLGLGGIASVVEEALAQAGHPTLKTQWQSLIPLINEVPEDVMLAEIRAACVMRHYRLVKRLPQEEANWHGWVRRDVR